LYCATCFLASFCLATKATFKPFAFSSALALISLFSFLTAASLTLISAINFEASCLLILPSLRFLLTTI